VSRQRHQEQQTQGTRQGARQSDDGENADLRCVPPQERAAFGARPEREHEGDQVDREGPDPDEGNRAEVVGDEVRDGEQRHRRGETQGEPVGRGRRAGSGRRRIGLPDDSRGCHQPSPGCQREGHHHVGDEQPAPSDALGLEPEERLDQERIGEEPQQGADVRGRVEVIGVFAARLCRARQPLLRHDARRGEHAERDRRGDEQREQDRDDGPSGAGLRHLADADPEQGGGHEHEMPAPHPGHHPVGIEIADEQGSRVEHHAGVPHVEAGAVARDQPPPDHGLEGEQQQRSLQHEQGEHGALPADADSCQRTLVRSDRRRRHLAAHSHPRERPSARLDLIGSSTGQRTP
jgi:hypothetical protein